MSRRTGYRALPPSIPHPSRARRFTSEEAASFQKRKLQEAPSLCAGHDRTIVWYAEGLGYIIEVRFTAHPAVYVKSLCTFTPTLGMDKIDGEFAQDVEEYVLQEALGYKGNRLSAYPTTSDVPVQQYLRARGYTQ